MHDLKHLPTYGFYCVVFPPEHREDWVSPTGMIEFRDKVLEWCDGGEYSSGRAIDTELVSETPERALFRTVPFDDRPTFDFEVVPVTMELWEGARALWNGEDEFLPFFDELDDVRVWIGLNLRGGWKPGDPT